MRTITLITALAATLILPGAVLGVEFVSVSGVADCNGWSSDVEIWFREGATHVELSYDVVLTDAQGTEMERFTAVEPLAVTVGPPVTFTLAGAFAGQPDGGCMVTAEYHLYDYFTDGFNDQVSGFTATPSCAPVDEDPVPTLCTHSARWWRHHRDQWPADELTVGDDLWDTRTLQHVLNRPAWGNVRLLLARQVIAAKFNAMLNPGAAPEAEIAAADRFLADNDAFDRLRGRDWWRRWLQELRKVRDLMAPLMTFNRHGCDDEPAGSPDEGGLSDLELVDKALAGEEPAPVPVEDISLGALKARYR